MTQDLTILILCGGKGERLRPLTHNLPKPLIEVNSKPILSYIFDHLTGYGFNNFIIGTGYKSQKIEQYLEKAKPTFKYKTINSGDVDIIERLKDTSGYIKQDFMILYGDTISDVDINSLIKFHGSHKNPITMTVWPLRTEFGVVDLSPDNEVIEFQEKPELGKWINIGYFYCKHEILDMIADYQTFEDFLYAASEQRIISAYKHKKNHLTINNLSELDKAEKELSKITGDQE